MLSLEMPLLRFGSSCLLERTKKIAKKGKDSAVDLFLFLVSAKKGCSMSGIVQVQYSNVKIYQKKHT